MQLNSLTNVSITSPATNDILKFNGSVWVNSIAGSGAGNMSTSIYDIDNDGIVDNSENLNGQIPSYYLQASNTLGILSIASGGTNASTANSALNNLLPSQTSNAGKFLTTDGSNSSWTTITSNPGTVTSVSIISSNGFAGTIASSTSAPSITLSTTITGILKGNGSAISSATSGTDYELPLTFNSPISRISNTVSIVDAVADGSTKGAATFTASDFNSSSGLISIDYTNGQSASGSTKGFLTSTDWNTFNSKESALTFNSPLSRSINTISIVGTALTKTDDTNVTLTLGGSPSTALLNAASLTLGWTGQLAISRGGTGQSTANAALNALLPTQTGNNGKVLQTDGTNTS